MDWDTDWMIEEGDDKYKLMPLNKKIKLSRKMPEPLQKYLDDIIRAYDEWNIGMYTFLEECIEPESKKMLSSHRITKKEKDLIFAMLGWYVD